MTKELILTELDGKLNCAFDHYRLCKQVFGQGSAESNEAFAYYEGLAQAFELIAGQSWCMWQLHRIRRG